MGEREGEGGGGSEGRHVLCTGFTDQHHTKPPGSWQLRPGQSDMESERCSEREEEGLERGR